MVSASKASCPGGRTMLSLLSAFAQQQVPSLYIRQGPWASIAAAVAVGLLVPAISLYVTLWLALELVWVWYFYNSLVPQLVNFRPEDSGQPHSAEDVARIIDNVVFLLQRDPKAFWMRVTGTPCATGVVPSSTATCFIKALLFMFDQCECFAQEEQVELFKGALARVQEASGGFAPELSENEPSDQDVLGCNHVPSHIRSWIDDDHLGSIVQSTPLIMILLSQLVRMATICVVLACGFRREYTHGQSGVECWVWRPKQQSGLTEGRPLVLLPGAGFGLTSFLPLGMILQQRYSERTIVMYRLPWVEVCRPWVHLPQWSTVMQGLLQSFEQVGLGGCEIDVLSHSYGTAVANRLLRELCKSDEKGSDAKPIIHFLGLLDPIVLGGATTGLSGFVINQVGPDFSFAFCGNRAGVSTKEVLDYDPRHQGQCLGGIGVYMSANDLLVDVDLARHVLHRHVAPPNTRCCTEDDSFVHFCVDPTDNSFHGRWLVEIWCLGVIWGAPCAVRCLDLLESKLGKREKDDRLSSGVNKVKSSCGCNV